VHLRVTVASISPSIIEMTAGGSASDPAISKASWVGRVSLPEQNGGLGVHGVWETSPRFASLQGRPGGQRKGDAARLATAPIPNWDHWQRLGTCHFSG
jgi:hypothetical protein